MKESKTERDMQIEKKISENTTPPLTKAKRVVKKHPNYPSKNPNLHRDAKIIPAHRAIFDNYKDQGFRNLGKAIRKTNVYSEGVAQRVNMITKSKSWKLLMQEYLPEHTIALRHAELLDKRDYRKVESVDENGKKIIVEVDNGPETLAVSKGLELAYRLRGAFSKEEAPASGTVMYNLFYKPEVRDQMKTFEDGLKQTLLNEISKKNAADDDAREANRANGVEDDSDLPDVAEGFSSSKNINNK